MRAAVGLVLALALGCGPPPDGRCRYWTFAAPWYCPDARHEGHLEVVDGQAYLVCECTTQDPVAVPPRDRDPVPTPACAVVVAVLSVVALGVSMGAFAVAATNRRYPPGEPRDSRDA